MRSRGNPFVVGLILSLFAANAGAAPPPGKTPDVEPPAKSAPAVNAGKNAPAPNAEKTPTSPRAARAPAGVAATAKASAPSAPKVQSTAAGDAAKADATPPPRARVPVPKVAADATGFDLVGGQDDAIRELREAIELPLQHPDAFTELGIEPVHGILLHGPPGGGKTLLAGAAAASLGAKMFVINGSEVLSKWSGEGEKNLRKVFEDAASSAPAVIFIDEIDALAPNRDKVSDDSGKIVAQLLTLMNGVKDRKGVVVVAATNRPDTLDPALRRPGRLEKEVYVAPPNEAGRAHILAIHTRKMPLAPNVDLAAYAEQTPGFSGADLAGLTREAGMTAMRRQMPTIQARAATKSEPLMTENEVIRRYPEAEHTFRRQYNEVATKLGSNAPSYQDAIDTLAQVERNVNKRVPGAQLRDPEILIRKGEGEARAQLTEYDPHTDEVVAHWSYTIEHPESLKKSGRKLTVVPEDFEAALQKVHPSGLREYAAEVPNVHWSDIAGLDDVKERLKDAVELPLSNAAGIERIGVRPPRGVLLYGPPGTGKTMLAKAVATEARANFMSVKASDLVTKWYGESTRNVAELFNRARASAPVVIFIDEIDALAPPRGSGPSDSTETNKIVTEFLVQLDGLKAMKGVTIVAATNHPEGVDSALRRPGRIDDVIYVPLPDDRGRRQAFELHTRKMPLAADVDLGALVAKTSRYSGADIEAVCMKAGILALRENPNAKTVSMSQFAAALANTPPSVTPEMEKSYEAFGRAAKGAPPEQKFGFVQFPTKD